ncbi:putative DP-fucose transporter [Besnoitia besnoiti]|uniref:Putative DP-fucose transporter n=1 Tax=Besnoitia besnoiti TaxID=94643 RepID=A0A2A9MQ28_BESBE|nr:putative DP-fucose transporter [Besnoitia besnoiti]PFH38546.1 putative DP-fucose transporter [Besnoitia besnoiti]
MGSLRAQGGVRTFLPSSASQTGHRLPVIELTGVARNQSDAVRSYSSQNKQGSNGRLSCIHVICIASTVCVWYASSLILTAANKYTFDTLQIPLPLSVTFLHFSFIALILRLCFCAFPTLFPPLPSLPLSSLLSLIAPMAILAAADVALTNFSYHLIPISTLTLIKSSLVFFTYLLSIACGLEPFKLNTFATVVVIMVSICLTVPEMKVKRLLGVAVAFGAVFVGALRWVLVHRAFKLYPNLSILQLLLLMQPMASIALSPVVAFYELPHFIDSLADLFDPSRLFAAAVVTASGVVVAVVVVFSEFQVVSLTSSVSLCIAGVGKEILTIIMSMVIFDEVLSSLVLLGTACFLHLMVCCAQCLQSREYYITVG